MKPDVKVTLANPVTVKGAVSLQSAKGSENIHQDELNNICIIIKLSNSQSHKNPCEHTISKSQRYQLWKGITIGECAKIIKKNTLKMNQMESNHLGGENTLATQFPQMIKEQFYPEARQ